MIHTKLLANVLVENLRPNDLIARWGGEEFAIALPGLSAQDAKDVLDRVRDQLALALMTGESPRYTVSFGIADSFTGPTFDAILRGADDALYTAKEAGRDRVEVGTPATDPAGSLTRSERRAIAVDALPPQYPT